MLVARCFRLLLVASALPLGGGDVVMLWTLHSKTVAMCSCRRSFRVVLTPFSCPVRNEAQRHFTTAAAAVCLCACVW